MMMELFMILLVIFITIPFSILAFLTIWIYKDTKKRELNTFIWILVIWLIPFFMGLIIYLNTREKHVEIET